MISVRNLVGVLFFLLAAISPLQAQTDLSLFESMEARSIGPAGMSGRITAIDVVHRAPERIYLGSASGGLWFSDNGGVDWDPIFDKQPVASIGAISIFQANPDIIWVGTGEGNPRNSENGGNGVYRSLDGGRTWTHMGLDKTRNIHRIYVHRTNPDIVLVGAQGASWGDSEDRGVYRTDDAGKTWTKVLYTNDRTGIGEMVVDPSNPDKIFAAMWEYRRWPWFFKSGGKGSGLYVSHDNGRTWQQRTDKDGLPSGELGRMGLAVSASDPDVVYALVESKKTALYRSDNGGVTWTKRSDSNIGNRPFYYAEIYVDPKNENRVYNLHSSVTVSEDGGRTFGPLFQDSSVHPDHHAFWIHPDNPDYLIDGNDGGAAISHDRGRTWRFIENLPLAQFYHIRVDNNVPYNVYGGMQDNGSWRGPAYTWRAGGIRNAYWDEVAFGDGFDVLPAPWSDDYLYAMSQGGSLSRTHLPSGAQTYIQPRHPADVDLRFNWNAAIAPDPFDKNTIYYGSQFVHQSVDRGDSWEIISPDLTTNDPEKQKQIDSGGLSYDVTQAENHTTIVTIEPSPLENGVIWVGTDDGNLQVTRNGGQTWENVSANVKGVPSGTWIPQIRASSYQPGAALVVFDNHRRDDWTPYAFQTTDYGKTWRSLVDGEDVFGFCLSILQDPVEPNLFFLGTETGLYVSLDGAASWEKWTNGYPTVPTIDLTIHPREHDLIIGTFGRGAYVLDDIRPLRTVASTPSVLKKTVHVFDSPDAYLAEYSQAAGTRFYANAIFAGENRPRGAMFTWLVNKPDSNTPDEADETAGPKDKNNGEAVFEILDQSNTLVRKFTEKADTGLHRTIWNLRRDGVRSSRQERPNAADADAPAGRDVLPGDYTVRISYAGESSEVTFSVLPDPRLAVPIEQMRKTDQMQVELEGLSALATEAADRIRDAQRITELLESHLKGKNGPVADSLRSRIKTTKKQLEELNELFEGKEVQGIRRDPNLLPSRIGRAGSYLSSWDGGSATAQVAIEQAKTSLSEVIEKVNGYFSGNWVAFRSYVDESNLSLFEDFDPITFR